MGDIFEMQSGSVKQSSKRDEIMFGWVKERTLGVMGVREAGGRDFMKNKLWKCVKSAKKRARG